MVGLSYRTAGVALRERLAVSGEALDGVLRGWGASHPSADVVLVSTCNRTELYVARPTHEEPGVTAATAMLAELGGVAEGRERAELDAALVHREQGASIEHLMRLCVGLESMVVGEPQVLGQVKRAYETAVSAGTVRGPLHGVFQSAIAAGKRARAQTGIDAGRRSVGGVAIDLIEQVFESVRGKRVACVGAGEMAKAALRRLVEAEPARVWVVNRTASRAAGLAESMGLRGERGGARPWGDLSEVLVEADVVVTGTGATEPVLTTELVSGLIRRRRARPMVVMDMGLPRDVEPGVGGLRNVYLYNVDDLRRVVAARDGARDESVVRCESLAAEAAARCYREMQHRDIGRVVGALRRRLGELGEDEAARTHRRLLADGTAGLDDDRLARALAEHNHRLINKLLHVPLTQMREAGDEAPLGFYAAALRRLFGVAGDEPGGAEGGSPAASEGAHEAGATARVEVVTHRPAVRGPAGEAMDARKA
jgi:glutamyl-tRNA reductase